jgi:DNA-binding beta-propeller fold protein YncE
MIKDLERIVDNNEGCVKMAVTESQIANKSVFLLKNRKIKLIYVVLLISLSIMLSGGIFLNFYVQGRTPYVPLLPAFVPSVPQYQYSIFGEGNKMLTKPMSIAVTTDRIYTSDNFNNRIQVFSINGESLFSFGKAGDQPGQFRFPYGIEVSSNNEIYVADSYNGNISVFDNVGIFLRYFALDEGAITQPAGMLIHGNNLYVCNLDPSEVLVFSLESEELLHTIGSAGSGEAQLSFANDLTVGPDGNLYVSDTGNNRIQVFTLAGDFIKTLPIDESEIYNPRGIAFNAHGQLYVVSKLNSEVVVFNNNWKKVDRFGEKVLNLPNGITIDKQSRFVYVTDHISVLAFQ